MFSKKPVKKQKKEKTTNKKTKEKKISKKAKNNLLNISPVFGYSENNPFLLRINHPKYPYMIICEICGKPVREMNIHDRIEYSSAFCSALKNFVHPVKMIKFNTPIKVSSVNMLAEMYEKESDAEIKKLIEIKLTLLLNVVENEKDTRMLMCVYLEDQNYRTIMDIFFYNYSFILHHRVLGIDELMENSYLKYVLNKQLFGDLSEDLTMSLGENGDSSLEEEEIDSEEDDEEEDE